MLDYVRKLLRRVQHKSRGKCSKNRPGNQGLNTWRNVAWNQGKKAKRKPLTGLCVKGHFTEDRDEWQQELQRHCEEVYTDQEETKEVQEYRFEFF